MLVLCIIVRLLSFWTTFGIVVASLTVDFQQVNYLFWKTFVLFSSVKFFFLDNFYGF